jgi:hypothetical protein
MTPTQFDRAEIQRLLRLLDARLRRRGVGASVYVVGGAAIAVTVLDGRRTADVDAVASSPIVLEEARLLAEAEGVVPTWLSEAVRPWVPPRPEADAEPPHAPGLVVQWAPADHLLAMKLIAMRSRDASDIVELATLLGLGDEAANYADLLERVYPGEGVLAQLLGVGDGEVREEALRRGEIVGRLLRDGA